MYYGTITTDGTGTVSPVGDWYPASEVPYPSVRPGDMSPLQWELPSTTTWNWTPSFTEDDVRRVVREEFAKLAADGEAGESALDFARWLTAGVGVVGLEPDAVEYWTKAIERRDKMQRAIGRLRENSDE